MYIYMYMYKYMYMYRYMYVKFLFSFFCLFCLCTVCNTLQCTCMFTFCITFPSCLGCLCLDVPQRRLQASSRQQVVLQALQKVEEGGLVGEDQARVGDAVVANQNQLSRVT